MVTEDIPDPERYPAPDNIRHALMPKEPPNTFRTGRIEVNPERHDAVKLSDPDGNSYKFTDIQPHPDDPEAVIGTLIGDESATKEPKRVKMKRLIQESKPYQFLLIDHKKATEVTTAVVTISAVAVASLVIRRRRRKS